MTARQPSIFIALCLIFSYSTKAQLTDEEHAARHESIDAKLDEIIRLLEYPASNGSAVSQPAATHGGLADTETLPEKQAKYFPGPVLDVHLLTDVQDGPMNESRHFSTLGKEIPRPQSRPFGSMIDLPPLFDADAYMSDGIFKSVSQKNVGLDWNGYLAIPTDGEYTLGIELSISAHEPWRRQGVHFPACTMSAEIEGLPVLRLFEGTNTYSNAYNGRAIEPATADGALAGSAHNGNDLMIIDNTWSKTMDIPLSKGVYGTSIWLACVAVDPALTRPSFKIRAPADRGLRTVTAQEFLHKRN